MARWIAGTTGQRAYAQGAIVDRLSTDWRLSSASGNQETRADLRELRRRARALFRDDPYVNAAVREFAQNVIGDEGIRLHPRNTGADGAPAERSNGAIADAWRTWGHAETASVDRAESWVDLQQRAVESWVVDGEVFVRKHSGFRNPFGFALELIDPDLLDEQMNRDVAPNANAIVMGVEIDKWGAPIAYHFWTRHPAEPGPRTRVAVPADEVCHLFKRKRPGQVRGVSLLAPILFRLKMLGAYEDAEVTAARIGSSKMGFFEVNPQYLDAWTPPTASEKILMDVAPGSLEQLPPGMTFKEWDPKHPNTAFATFVKSLLRSIAQGLGVAYTTLSGDLEGVNYSSIRAGLLSERDFWRGLQKWVAEHLHRPVFEAWLEMAILSPKLSLPSKLAERWHDVEWRGRGWKWVDPFNEIRAHEMAIGLGLVSRQQLCAELGRDFETVLQDLKREKELSDQYDVYIDGVAQKTDTAQPVGGITEHPAPDGGNVPGDPAATAAKPAPSPAAQAAAKPAIQKVA